MSAATVTVTIFDVDLTVAYDYTPYRPATHWEPEEGGDIEITGIHLDGHNVDGMLAGWVHDQIDQAIDVDIADRRREAEENRAMARRAA